MTERKHLFQALVVLVSAINLAEFRIGIELTNFPKSLLLYLFASIGLLLLLFWKSVWEGPKEQQWHFFVLAFILSLFWTAINTNGNYYKILFGELNRMNGILTWISLIVIFVFAIQTFQRIKFDVLLGGLIITSGIQTLIGLIDLSETNATGELLSINPINGTLGNPNFLSAYISLGALAATYYVFNNHFGVTLRVATGIFVMGMIAVVLQSESQQGLIVYASGTVVFIWHKLNEKFKSLPVNIGYGIGLLGAISVFIAGIFNMGPASELIYRQSVGLRIQYWLAAIEMFKSNLLSGVGIASYGDRFPSVRTSEQISLAGEAQTISNDAHNIFLQNAAVGGIPLSLAYLALVVFVFYRAYIGYKDSENRLPIVALTAIWTGYTAQSLLSINQIGLAVWGWLIAGSIVGYSLKLPSKFEIDSKLATIAIVLGLLLGFGVQYKNVSIQTSLRSIFNTNLSMSSPEQQAATIDRLYEISQDLPSPEYVVFVSRSLIQVKQYEKAIQVLKIHDEKFENSVAIVATLASLLEMLEKFDEARPYWERAILLDPQNEDFKQKLAAYPVG